MIFLGLLPSWEEIFRGLMALLCQAIYPIIAFLYNLFINISKVNILSSDTVHPIYQRVTIILTIIMIFYVTFEFVKFVVQPDGISDKEKGVGKIAYRMIAVVVLIAMVPNIFTGAMKLQSAIVDKNIIGKIILGKDAGVTTDFGGTFSAQILSMFYNVDEEYAGKQCDGIPCQALVAMNMTSLREDGHLKFLTKGINSSGTITETIAEKEQSFNVTFINFDGLFAVVVGIIVGYILVLYSIDLGVRWAQLLYLQIIAPIPIIGFLSPKKDGIFQKWCKQCLTTYLDLFLRISIIYFGLLICSLLLEAWHNDSGILADLAEVSGFMKTLVYVVLVLGVMLFVQKAPKLLQELFPKSGAASGNFGLKAGERVAPMAARTLGAALGGTRMVTGALARARDAHIRRKANDLDTREKRRKHRQQTQQHRDELEDKTAKEQRLKKYGKAYNDAKTEHDNKRKALNAAGNEYKAAREARINAEKAGKTGAEIEALKKKEAEAHQKAKIAAQEYKPALDNLTRQRTNLLGKEAIEKEKAERAEAARKAGAEREQLKQHQANLDSATRDAETAKSKEEAIFSKLSLSQEETAQAEHAVKDAQERQKDAQNIISEATNERDTIREEIAKEEAQLNAAKEAGLTDQNEIAKMEGKIASLRYQESKAQDKINNASAEKDQAMNDEMELLSDLKSKQQKTSDIQQKYEEAQNIRKTAEETRNAALENRNSSQENLRKQMNDIQKQQYTQGELEDMTTTATTDRIVAESKLSEDINKSRGTSYAGAVVGGAVVGGYHGITHGVQATKASEIFKKASEGYKADNKSIENVQKYYESGGTKTFVGRTLDQVAKTVIGGSTEYHQTQITDIKPLETKIKAQESYASLEADVKTKVDAVKDRAESKLEKEEIKIDATGFNKPSSIPDSVNVDTSKAQNLSDVYRAYRANAEQKQSEADAAAQELQKQETTSISGETTQQRELRIQNARIRAQQTAQIAQDARFAKEQIKKKASEYAFTKILKDGIANARANGSYDQVMVDKVDDMLQSVRNARNNPETVEAFKKYYDVNSKKYYDENSAEYNAFITGNFDSYEQLDNVQIALTNIATGRTRDISGLKEQKRQIEASDKTAAEKADAEFNGGK